MHLFKNIFPFLLVVVLCIFSTKPVSAQLDNSNNLLQQDIGSSGTVPVDQGGIDGGSTFEPGPVDPNTSDPFETETNPGGPGGDIDDITPVPIDNGVIFLLSIGLLVGLIQTRKNKVLLLKKVI